MWFCAKVCGPGRTTYSHGLNLADFTNDGAVDIQDNTLLSGDWGAGDPASPADATGADQASSSFPHTIE